MMIRSDGMHGSARQTYFRLVLASAGVGVVIGLLGYYPTLRIAGAGTVDAMVAGIGIGFVAGCVGAVPVARAGRAGPNKAAQSVLAATMLRFLIVVALTVAAVFSGWFERGVLALWVGLAYLSMLVVDSIFAVHLLGGAQGNP